MSGLTLGERHKTFYEFVYRMFLPRRMPIILRLDGRAFHSYVKGLNRPWDERLEEVMNLTAIKLCEEIQGAQICYAQSDELTILIHNYKKLNSEAWFGNNLQKMVSVAAGTASAWFTYYSARIWAPYPMHSVLPTHEIVEGLLKPAVFDCRAFVVPESEVNDNFLWRQQDATRNSISMLAQSLFSHSELQGKSSDEMQEMTFAKGHNWNDLPTRKKRGRCIRKVERNVSTIIDIETYPSIPMVKTVTRSSWEVDNEIPIFSQDPSYIEDLLKVDSTI